MEPIYRRMEREQRIADGKRMLPPPVEDRSRRKSYEEIVRDCHAKGIMIGDAKQRASEPIAPETFIKKYGIDEAQFNKIPDAKLPSNWK